MVNPDSNFPVSSLYYIGLTKREGAAPDADPSESRSIFNNLVSDFVRTIMAWHKRDETMFASVCQMRKADIPPDSILAEDDELPAPAVAAPVAPPPPAMAPSSSAAAAAAAAASAVPAVEVKHVAGNDRKGLRSSEDVYHKLKWNSKLDSSEYSIVYEDRFLGLQEVTFANFKKCDDDELGVPWHRVQFFKRNGEIVWDRKNKIDKI